MKWNDIRAFVAVVETGSTLAASRRLRNNQTTVSRRIDALESATNLTPFQPDVSGYERSFIGRELLETNQPAVDMFDKIPCEVKLLMDFGAESLRITGPVKVVNHWVYPILTRLRLHNPRAIIEVDTSETEGNLFKGKIDLTVRMAA